MAEVELPNPEDLREIKEKKFTRSVALVTALFAVALAITSLGGSNAMKEMILAQQQASDQWAFYQAKAIREHLYKSQKMMLESELALMSGIVVPEAAERFRSTVKTLSDEEVRYNAEKKDIEQAAIKLEKERDVNRSKDPYFDYAEVLLQIAIVMASVAILSSSRAVFYFSLVAACLGVLLSINGFTLFVMLPFLH